MRNRGITGLALLVVLTVSLFVTLQSRSAVRQPHMEAALEHLRQAEAELNQAEADKGGHREKALQLVQGAKNEVNAGIAYANAH